MDRYQVTLWDRTDIDLGVTKIIFDVTAESPEEAEFYVRQMIRRKHLPSFHVRTIDLIATADC